MPFELVERFREMYAEYMGREVSYGEAETEAGIFVRGLVEHIEYQTAVERRERIHRILTNWKPDVRLGPVDSRFFGDDEEGGSLRISL